MAVLYNIVPRWCVDFYSRIRVISTPSGLVQSLVISVPRNKVCVLHSWTALIGPSMLPSPVQHARLGSGIEAISCPDGPIGVVQECSTHTLFLGTD